MLPELDILWHLVFTMQHVEKDRKITIKRRFRITKRPQGHGRLSFSLHSTSSQLKGQKNYAKTSFEDGPATIILGYLLSGLGMLSFCAPEKKT